MQPGQFLVNKYGTREKLIDIIDKAAAFEKDSGELVWYSKSKLLENGWSLLEEPWVPGDEESFFTVLSDGDIKEIKWQICTKNYYRLMTNNIHRTHKNAELYRQKLIERMGRKEN